ncbi:UNVERIFIED_CONTAM: hypothetical protein Sindi_1834100 [Sesamum indicum]
MGFCFRLMVPRAPRVVQWSTHNPVWFKLNSDESSLGNLGPAAVAGIIRDAIGQVHLAYQFALGTTTSVVSELTAVWHGLELDRAHSLAPIVVEVDANEFESDVRHIFREANGAADHLAKDAASRQLTWVLYQRTLREYCEALSDWIVNLKF